MSRKEAGSRDGGARGIKSAVLREPLLSDKRQYGAITSGHRS